MNINKRKELMFNEAISMNKFLQHCYCIYEVDFSCFTHQELSILIPYVKRTSFEHALKNIELLADGTIIMVKDKLGNPAPYINPVKENNNTKETLYEEIDKELFIYPIVENMTQSKIDRERQFAYRHATSTKRNSKPKERKLKYPTYYEYDID